MGLASRFFFVLVSFLSRPVNRRNELKSISAPSRMSFFERNIFPYVTSQLLLLVSPLPILWTILPLLLPIKKEPLEHFAQINFFVDRSCNGYLGVHLGITAFKFKLAHATRRRGSICSIKSKTTPRLCVANFLSRCFLTTRVAGKIEINWN